MILPVREPVPDPREEDRRRRSERGRLDPRGWSFKTWLGLAGGVFALAATGALVATAAIAVFIIRASEGLPGIEDLAAYEPPVMTRVHAGDGKLIAEYARESRVFVPIETIPPHIIAAFLSAEDKNFYEHTGIDYMGTFRGGLRSVVNKLRGAGGLQSGSTITQQVAKNFKLTASQTFERKAQEFVLAKRLEEAFTKDEILELYLNEIYLGRRAYGVAAAALLYFGKPLDDLSLSEAAYLAALPKAPNNYHPTRNKARAIDRRNWVLTRMAANGYISADQADQAAKDDLVVSERLEGSTYLAAEYFVEEVRRRVFSMYGEEELYDGGLSIRTTLDTNLQIAARKALRDGLEDYDRRHGYRGPVARIELGAGWEERLAEVETFPDIGDWRPAVVLSTAAEAATVGFLDGSKGEAPLSEMAWARKVNADDTLGPEPEGTGQILAKGDVIYVAEMEGGGYALRQVPAINGGVLAMDPHTGRVLAMVGGYSFRASQFNRATQARRQPGSSFKPFVYAAALDAGKTPVSKVLDAPYVSPSGTGEGFYKPENYTGRWYGMSTLRLGVEKSRNVMTVRLANDIGLDKVSEYGEAFGVYDHLPPYESMALGAGETTLWRMVTAYSMLDNGGKKIEPTILDRVQDRTGATIFAHDQRVCDDCDVDDWRTALEPHLPDLRPEVVDPVTAYQITSILEGVVLRGTATALRSVGKPLAGKTGTTNDFHDAWFVGFSPDLAVGVYVGYDAPQSLGEHESGGRAAAPIFKEFMTAALKDQPALPFRIPPGVRLVKVDATTGALARPGNPNAILEAFRPGTEPTKYEAEDGDAGDYVSSESGLRVAGPYDERRLESVTSEDRGGGFTPGLRPDAPGGKVKPAAEEPVRSTVEPGEGEALGALSPLDEVLRRVSETRDAPDDAPTDEETAASPAETVDEPPLDTAERQPEDEGVGGLY